MLPISTGGSPEPTPTPTPVIPTFTQIDYQENVGSGSVNLEADKAYLIFAGFVGSSTLYCGKWMVKDGQLEKIWSQSPSVVPLITLANNVISFSKSSWSLNIFYEVSEIVLT